MSREDEIVNEIGTLRHRVDELQAELRGLREAKAGVKVGDVVLVKWRRQDAPIEVRITQLTTWASGKPWVKGTPRKKDGSWSKVERNAFTEWEKP